MPRALIGRELSRVLFAALWLVTEWLSYLNYLRDVPQTKLWTSGSAYDLIRKCFDLLLVTQSSPERHSFWKIAWRVALEPSLCKVHAFFGCYRILWTSLLANCLYLRGMLRIACGQNIEETEVQEIFYIIKESNLQEGSPLIPPLS